MVRRVALSFLFIVLVLGECGCSMRGKNENLEKQVIKYLENKYELSFFVIEIYCAGIDVYYDEIICGAEKYPEKEFKVYREIIDGQDVFRDDFFGVLKENEYLELLCGVVDECIGNNKCYFRFQRDVFETEYTGETSINDIMSNNKHALASSVWVFAPDSEKEEIKKNINRLFVELEEKCFVCAIDVYVVTDYDYELINEKNYTDFITNGRVPLEQYSCVVK